MLLRFFVSNFMSFSDEVEFNLFPGALKTHKEHIYSHRKIDLLKATAIYGSNGSGKSNFIKAVHFLHDVVVKGDLSENEVKCLPFRLNPAMLKRPSEFGLECQIGNKFYGKRFAYLRFDGVFFQCRFCYHIFGNGFGMGYYEKAFGMLAYVA